MGLGISLLITLPALDGISLFGTELSVLGPTAAGTAGLVGASIIDRILDSDDDDDADDGGGGGDGLMDDEFGGGMDDEFGGGMGDDFGGMDDDFGGMDDDFGGGGGGAAGADMDELEHQVDELENEVASLSSTVNTVKSENTEISDRIEDVEEDVRNLLDIYEMVTRGINPFVDEQDASDFDVGGAGGGGGLGLFDDGEDDTQQDEDVDDSVMDEDADGFFDDDFEDLDEDDDDDFGDDDFEELDEDDADDFGDDFEELDEDDADDFGDETGSEEMVSDQDSTGGKSFSELKEEYDSGDASWADEDDEADDEFGEMDDSLEADDDLGGMDDSFEDDDFAGEDSLEADDDIGGMDDEFGEMDDEPDEAFGNGSETPMEVEETATEESTGATAGEADAEGDFEYVTSDQLSSSGDKPYLTSIPGDYVGDLVVMEWLEFLVEESSVTDAARAVNYYERIDWIDENAADHLRSFLSGFGNVDRNKVEESGTDQLTRGHHVHSLKYIMKLNNGTTATSVILDRWDSFAQGDDGL